MQNETFTVNGVELKLTLDNLNYAIREWGKDRGITINGTAEAQLVKTMEELGELARAVARDEDIDDHIGDVIVTLIMVASIKGTNLTNGMLHAYNEIKDRKGFLNEAGIFVKEADQHVS